MMSQSVMRKKWVALFKVKVTVRAYLVQIWKHFGDLCFHLDVDVFECMI